MDHWLHVNFGLSLFSLATVANACSGEKPFAAMWPDSALNDLIGAYAAETA